MNEYIQKAEEFSKFLASSPMYANFIKARSNISVKPELSSEMKEFRQMQLDYELSVLQGGHTDFEKEKELSRRYSRLILNQEIREYLNCEKALMDMLNKVDEIIAKACPVNL